MNDFNCLSVVFNFTGSFVLNNQCIIGKGLKVMHVLLQHIKRLEVNPKLCLQLFNALVGPILNYGCPIWVFSNSKDIERLHLELCKTLLGAGQSTSNAAVYGELRRVPLYINRYVQVIKYWFKVISLENEIVKSVYDNSILINLRDDSWYIKVKLLLERYRFYDVWLRTEQVYVPTFISSFKQRVADVFFYQEWFADLSNNNVLNIFNVNLKLTFGYESYLSTISAFTTKRYLTRMCISANRLCINLGRLKE